MLYRQRYDLDKKRNTKTEEKLLSHVSHRIRTPLNSVIGFSKLLMNGDLSRARTKEFAERIMDSGYQILQYFQNMMDISEVESGMVRVKPVRVRVNQLLEDIVSGYKDRLDNDGSMDIYLMHPENVIAAVTDEYILERVVENVIELSRTHIEEGLVTIEYGMVQDRHLAIEIRGVRSQEINGRDEESGQDPDYDYFTWKAIQMLIDLIDGSVTHRCRNQKAIYTISLPVEGSKKK